MASAFRRSALEPPGSHSRRDAVVQQFLSLADALARRFQQRFAGDHGRLVRVSRREHEKGLHPWGHLSLDDLASPESEAPASEGLGVSAEALLQRLPANEAAILRLRVLEGQSLRCFAGELGVSTMTVSRHEKAALAALREQLA
jgi:RNA polymerase sigma factor (sigma-70 family)